LVLGVEDVDALVPDTIGDIEKLRVRVEPADIPAVEGLRVLVGSEMVVRS